MSHIQRLLEKIREKLHHVEDAGRLKFMHERMDGREHDLHPDFLDTHHPDGKRQSRLEHHAANFWHYYYPGEHPNEIISDFPSRQVETGIELEHRKARERMIDRDTAVAIKDEYNRLSDFNKIQQHWMYESMVGELALDKEEYAQAERSFKAVLVESERSLVPVDLLSKVLRHLARALSAQGKYEEFEKVYERALMTDSEVEENGGHFPEEEELNRIASEYLRHGKDEEAEAMFSHVLSVLERVRGPKRAVVLRCLNDLAGIHAKKHESIKAEELLKRAIEIAEASPDNLTSELVTSMYNLGSLYKDNGRSDEAHQLFGRALSILEKHTGE